jgi:hypothetical protein
MIVPQRQDMPHANFYRQRRAVAAGEAPMARSQDRVGPLLLISAGAAALIATAPARGETPARVRGTITEVDDGSITLKEQDGRVITLKTGAYTTYADVVPSSVEEIKVNDFVGAAVKGASTALVAVELAIVPDNMRAGRISFYGWDPLPDPTAVQTVRGATNGLVSNVSPVPTKLTKTNMTNGVVSAEAGGESARTLTITYADGSKSFRMTVPPNAPVVRYILSDRSAVAVGSAVMIKTNPGDQAGLVTIGKGVKPPM